MITSSDEEEEEVVEVLEDASEAFFTANPSAAASSVATQYASASTSSPASNNSTHNRLEAAARTLAAMEGCPSLIKSYPAERQDKSGFKEKATMNEVSPSKTALKSPVKFGSPTKQTKLFDNQKQIRTLQPVSPLMFAPPHLLKSEGTGPIPKAAVSAGELEASPSQVSATSDSSAPPHHQGTEAIEQQPKKRDVEAFMEEDSRCTEKNESGAVALDKRVRFQGVSPVPGLRTKSFSLKMEDQPLRSFTKSPSTTPPKANLQHHSKSLSPDSVRVRKAMLRTADDHARLAVRRQQDDLVNMPQQRAQRCTPPRKNSAHNQRTNLATVSNDPKNGMDEDLQTQEKAFEEEDTDYRDALASTKIEKARAVSAEKRCEILEKKIYSLEVEVHQLKLENKRLQAQADSALDLRMELLAARRQVSEALHKGRATTAKPSAPTARSQPAPLKWVSDPWSTELEWKKQQSPKDLDGASSIFRPLFAGAQDLDTRGAVKVLSTHRRCGTL